MIACPTCDCTVRTHVLTRREYLECDDSDDEEIDLNMQDALHDLSCNEEIQYWDILSPFGTTNYDGTRFYD